MNKVLDIVARRTVFQNIRLLYCGHHQVKFYQHINHGAPIKAYRIQDDSNLFLIKRFKHKKKAPTKNLQEDLESDEDEEELELDESKLKTIIITAKVNSLRVDSIAKAGLGITRKKVEEAFYESKIRINGKKILKLSAQVNINDEIDLIRGRSEENPNHIIVLRATVLSVEPVSDAIRVKLGREKLLIEEYAEEWKH